MTDLTGLRDWGLMHHNALLSIVPLTLAFVISGEPARIATFAHLDAAGFWAGLVACSCGSVVLQFATQITAGRVSPLATSVTGNMKGVFAMVLGLFLFEDSDRSPMVLLGLAVSVAASGAYSWIKLNESNEPK